MNKLTNFVWSSEEKIVANCNSNPHSPTTGVVTHGMGFDYKRYCNDTNSKLLSRLQRIYGASALPARLCNSAMSALTVLAIKNKSKNFYVFGDTYFETRHSLNHIARNVFVDCAGPYDYVVCEPISNSLLIKTDIKKVSREAHSVGAKVVVDNSTLSCYNYNPFEDGADVIIESLSKYADGHGDVIGGVLIGEDVDTIASQMGMFMQPHEAYMAMRGLSTLPIRLERQSQNAKVVRDFLLTLTPNVLFDDRISIITCSFGSSELHFAIAKNCKLCSPEDTFGQVNTIVLPQSGCNFRNFPNGYEIYKQGMIRFSVGLEDPMDIIEDIKQAYFKALTEVSHGIHI